MDYFLSILLKAEDPAQYAKLANEGVLLGYPVKIKGQHARPDNGIHYHSTIKYFDPSKDHPHAIHDLAQHLPLNPPDAKNTQLKFDTFKDRFGNDVNVITLHGNSAAKIKEHNGKFAGMGFPSTFEWTPHISVDKQTFDSMKSSGAKTAHEAGIEFGSAQLKKGPRVLKTYHHAPDSSEPTVPDESDFTAKIPLESKMPKIAASENIENDLNKGALKNAGIALGMAGALAGGSSHAEAANRSPASIPHHASVVPSYDHKRMLNTIAQVESNNGANTNHPPTSSGELAFGKYGLMPNTIKDTINGHKDLKSKYGKALALKGQQLQNYMQDNKGLEDVIADRHLSHMEHVLGKNPEHLGFGWLNGIQGTLNAKKNKEDIKNHWHVRKIRNAYGKGK